MTDDDWRNAVRTADRHDFYNTAETAERLGVRLSAVVAWVNGGQIGPARNGVSTS
jgi:hypothetical protein